MSAYLKRLPAGAPFVRYLLAGGTAFASEYGTFYLLFSVLSAQVYIANSVSFAVGLAVSFTLNRIWAFSTTTFKFRKHQQAVLYGSLAVLNLLLTNVMIGLLKAAGMDPRLGKIVVMLMIIVWNFYAFKLVIFAAKKER